MKKITIKFFGEEQEVATIFRDEEGNLFVESEIPELSSLIKKIVKDNSQLPFYGGETQKGGRKVVEATTKKMISQNDPEYLEALSGYLSQEKNNYKGKRLQAYTTDEIERIDK